MPDTLPQDDNRQAYPNRDAASAFRANDTRVLTPLLLMALIIAIGALLFSITGQVPTAHS